MVAVAMTLFALTLFALTLFAMTLFSRPACQIAVACIALFGALMPGKAAEAHPHSFISVQVDVQFNGQGQITALHQRWLFDQLYTSYILGSQMQQTLATGQISDEVVEEMTANITSLENLGWFTRIEQNGTRKPLSSVSDFDWSMVRDRMALGFVTHLETPLEVLDAPVDYAVYDPTYYIQMTHGLWSEDNSPDPDARTAAQATRLLDAPDGCSTSLFAPQPTEEMLLSALLADSTTFADMDDADMDDTEGDQPYELGREFAEQVTISCK
ncbi:MAG: DUF1007 family protein [Alphaproteobacteria bacterium]